MSFSFSPVKTIKIIALASAMLSFGLLQAQDTVMYESFDYPAIFPPIGWTNIKVAGVTLPGNFSRVTTGGAPTQEPHSDPAEAKFTSFYNAAGTACDLSSFALDFTIAGTYTVNFWMYRDAGPGTDKMEVYVNTTNASAGGTLIGTINRTLSATPIETTAGWHNYTFTVPSTYATSTNYIIFKAISGFGFNMYLDDITVLRNVVTIPGCMAAGYPADASTGICRNVTLSWPLTPFATGYKLTFGANAPLYNDIANNVDLGTALSYSALLNPSTTYKWKIRPYNGAGIAAGCVFNSFTTGADVCYCTPMNIYSACETLDFIDDFSTTGAVTNISNINTGCSGDPVGNYTFYSAKTVAANVGSFFNFSIQCGPDYGEGYGIWVDWNNDGDFDDAAEFAFQSSTPTTAIVTGVINVPAIAIVGITRMRVRCLFNAIPAASESCAVYSEGETEDYNMNVTTCTMVTYYQDADGDGYGTAASTTTSCTGIPVGYSANSTDCNDASATVNPGAVELCNGLDENCNALIDDNAAPAVITPAGATTVCKGASLILNAPTGAGYTYQWKRNGGVLAGATSASYSVTKSGNYTVTLTVPGGCSATSVATACTINANPNATISTPGGTDLCGFASLDLVANSGVGFTYQWYKDGGTIPGATAQTYSVTAAGAYRVKVTNASGCNKTSAVKTIVKSCKLGDEYSNDQVAIYPNPASSSFTLELTAENILHENALIRITDVTGRNILTTEAAIDNGKMNTTLSLNAADGLYLISVETADHTWNERVIIQH